MKAETSVINTIPLMTNFRLTQAVLLHKRFTFLEQKPQQQLPSIWFQWKNILVLKKPNPIKTSNLSVQDRRSSSSTLSQTKTGLNQLWNCSFRQNKLSILILSTGQREEYKLLSSNKQHVINTLPQGHEENVLLKCLTI